MDGDWRYKLMIPYKGDKYLDDEEEEVMMLLLSFGYMDYRCTLLVDGRWGCRVTNVDEISIPSYLTIFLKSGN